LNENMFRAKFIINPVAGAKSSIRKWKHIYDILRHIGLRFDFEITEGTGHAIELAREAVSKGYENIYAVGGDGTINEVANGILLSENPTGCTLGIISTGTGSDFIRSIGIPRNYIQACLSLGNPCRSLLIDTGLIEYWRNGKRGKRFFVNTAGVGLDAAVVDATNRLPKLFGGTIPYLAGLTKTLLAYKNRIVKIKFNSRENEVKVVSVIVANGKYAGGGMKFAPAAQLNDGLLDIIVVNDMSKFKLIKSFSRVYKGTHLELPEIHCYQTVKIDIIPRDRTLVYADGELLGESPVNISIMPLKLKVAL